jgi:uracil-DNA glycosylase
MKQTLQIKRPEGEEQLHKKFGHAGLAGIYGGGCIRLPGIMLVFMNPTARNLAAHPGWHGVCAPWIGVGRVWHMLAGLGLIEAEVIPTEWNEQTAHKLYLHVAKKRLYITNLATCTQPDARHLTDAVFRTYLPLFYKEIEIVKPKKIIAFGNQVSSILLQRPVSVSSYAGTKSEELVLEGCTYKIYPTYYPVGQGQRNMPKAIRRIKSVLSL